ncbi:hypothetical protein GGX14DRAFT_393524 [Mycena pura]|uniref:Uncharacterized protein n=1 Tax=Mycena pura TaxID=153505 RepID=A0AAD6VH15_9AGAR|nr:hypothetical protein GGX14DRAFT_393524 [Mycena pura]
MCLATLGRYLVYIVAPARYSERFETCESLGDCVSWGQILQQDFKLCAKSSNHASSPMTQPRIERVPLYRHIRKSACALRHWVVVWYNNPPEISSRSSSTHRHSSLKLARSHATPILLLDDTTLNALQDAIRAKPAKSRHDAIEICLPDKYIASLIARNGQKKGNKPAAGSKKKKAAGVLDLDHLSDGDNIDDHSDPGKRRAWRDSRSPTQLRVVHDLSRQEKSHVRLCQVLRPRLVVLFPLRYTIHWIAIPSTGSSFMEVVMMMSMMESQRTNSVLLATALGRNGGVGQPAGSFFVSPSRQPARRPEGIKIDDFAAELDATHPERNISRFLPIFRKEELCTVRDILRGGEKFLTSEKIGMKEATAIWFLEKASMEIS